MNLEAKAREFMNFFGWDSPAKERDLLKLLQKTVEQAEAECLKVFTAELEMKNAKKGE